MIVPCKNALVPAITVVSNPASTASGG